MIEEVVRSASSKFDELKNRSYSRVEQEEPEHGQVIQYEDGDHDVVPGMTDDEKEINKIFEGIDENI